MMKAAHLIAFALMMVVVVRGTDYYFSESDGDDSSHWCNQTSPCQTMSRFNALTWQTPFKPGDNILFKRGGTFRGQARDLSWWQGNETNPITFGAYGNESDPNPIIAGTYVLNGWSQSGNMYTAKVISNFTDVENVFVDGVKMPWSRIPNLSNPPETRYFTINSSGSNFVTTTGDNSPSGTWNGATLRVRIYLWSVTTATVQSHTFDGTTATFTLDQNFEQGYVPGPGWKFFVENKIAAVDQPGEWCFDAPSGTLTLYPPTSDFDPTQHVIEAAVYTNAWVYVVSKYMSWVNLTFWGQTSAAVLFQQSGSSSSNLVFENCQFIDQEQMGLQIFMADGVSITNCNFTGMQNSALNVQADNVVIDNNSITYIGMVQGHQNKGGGVGIQMTGANPVISFNTVTNMSYNGIVFSDSSNARIVNNYVNGVTLTMSDGGAIYTYGSQSLNSLVQSNIVMNSASLPWDGFTDGSAPLSHGIYIDNYCNNITIDSNTVVDVDGSCLFANSGPHVWTNNLLVGAGAEGTIVVEEMPGNTVAGNYYANNIVYVRHPEDVGMIKATSNVQPTTTKLATFEKNMYCNPYGSIFFTWNNAGYEGGKGWQSWEGLSGVDSGSSVCSESFGPFYDSGNVSSAVVLNTNPTFDNSTDDWVCSNCQMTWMSSSPVSSSGGSMKVTVGGPNSYTQIQTKGMTCVQGDYYRLRFNAYATQEVVFWTGVLENAPPYGIVPAENLVFVITNETRSYNVVFASAVNSACMVMIGATYGPETVLYFDDFYMEAVNMTQDVVWDYVAVNPTSEHATVAIPPGYVYTDIYNQGPVTCSVNLQPYTSELLIFTGVNTSPCDSPTEAAIGLAHHSDKQKAITINN